MIQQSLLESLLVCARDAGSKIMVIYERDFDVAQKTDNTPLTEADTAAHQHIVTHLQTITPDVPILSEEASTIAWEERKQWDKYWLVDPLDGTKEFIKHNDEFTVNIALIENNSVSMGVVYAPALDVMYYGAKDYGAFCQRQTAQPTVIKVKPHQNGEVCKIVGSRSHPSEALQVFVKDLAPFEFIPMGSSLKLCLVAEGSAHMYPRFGLTSEWDTAAAQCVVEQAGGVVVNADNLQSLRYNTKDSLLNPHFIVRSKQN